jgi:hypothetical protein
MSAARSPSDRPRSSGERVHRGTDMAALRARRAAARRRVRVARIDVGLGLAAALTLLLATPGLAITGLLAIVILAVCVGSVVRERRRRSAAAEAVTTREAGARPAPAARQPRRASERTVGDRTRSTR